MAEATVKINRAPVRTLWAAVVAERLGFSEDEVLSLGKAVAGLNAQAKGRTVGIFTPRRDSIKRTKAEQKGTRILVALCSRAVPAAVTEEGIRALHGQKTVEPDPVKRYLEKKFGPSLPAVTNSSRGDTPSSDT